MTSSPIDPNRLLLTGENPYIRLSETDDGPLTTDASFWRILFSPGGPGHVLFLQSDLTDDEPRVYTDNIAMARWLQQEIQITISAASADQTLPAIEATFQSTGDLRSFWTETIETHEEDISLTWYGLGEPFLSPNPPKDTEGRREGSGRGWVRELQGRWPGVLGQMGGRRPVFSRRTGPLRPYAGVAMRGKARGYAAGDSRDRGGARLRGRWVSCRLAVRPGTEWLAAGPRRD